MLLLAINSVLYEIISFCTHMLEQRSLVGSAVVAFVDSAVVVEVEVALAVSFRPSQSVPLICLLDL